MHTLWRPCVSESMQLMQFPAECKECRKSTAKMQLPTECIMQRDANTRKMHKMQMQRNANTRKMQKFRMQS